MSSIRQDAGGGPPDAEGPAPTRGAWKPEVVFAALLAAFGLVFALGIPPSSVPDEPLHVMRSYAVSLGHLTPRLMVSGWGGDEIPASVHATYGPFARIWGRPDQKVKLDDFRALAAASDARETRVPNPFFGAVMNPFVPYLPSAAGMAIARAMHLNPLLAFYAGRLSSLLFAVALVYWAIRITPAYKCALGAFALIPIAVQQLASYSPDAAVIPASFLLVAVLLRIAAGPGRAGVGLVALLLALTAWVSLCKFPYAMVAALFAAVPAARLGSRARHLALGCVLAALVVGTVATSTRMARGYAPDSRETDGYKTSISRQVQYIKAHKVKYLRACARTCIAYGGTWLDHLTVLGTLDTAVNPTVAGLFPLFLLAVVLLDQPAGRPIPARMKLAAATAGILALGLMLTAQYTWHSPVGNRIVEGMQGRYLIPLLPLAMLLPSSRSIRVHADPGALLAITAGGSVAALVVGVGAFVQRFYLADPAKYLTPLNTVAAAAAAGALLALAVRRARAGDALAGLPASS